MDDSERAKQILSQIVDEKDRDFLSRYIARLEKRSDLRSRDEYPDTSGGQKYWRYS